VEYAVEDLGQVLEAAERGEDGQVPGERLGMARVCTATDGRWSNASNPTVATTTNI
jgi:hypothetical protein